MRSELRNLPSIRSPALFSCMTQPLAAQSALRDALVVAWQNKRGLALSADRIIDSILSEMERILVHGGEIKIRNS